MRQHTRPRAVILTLGKARAGGRRDHAGAHSSMQFSVMLLIFAILLRRAAERTKGRQRHARGKQTTSRQDCARPCVSRDRFGRGTARRYTNSAGLRAR